MQELRFTKASEAVEQYLAALETSKQCNQRLLETISTIRFENEARSDWKKILRRLRSEEDLEGTPWVQRAEGTLTPLFQVRQEAWKRSHELRRLAQKAFDDELNQKRERLWSFAKDPSFQQALFELNPEFYKHVREYFDRPLPTRNSSMRKKETTLFSYLTRFCTKPAICGNSGLTSKLTLIDKKTDAFFNRHPKDPVSKAFFSQRYAQALAQAWIRNDAIQPAFALHLHPSVEISQGELVSIGWFAHPGMPETSHVPLSEELSKALLDSTGIFLHGHPAAVRKEAQSLLAARWLRSDLSPPLGCLDPLSYWSSLTFRGALPDEFSTSIRAFQDHLQRFESESLEERISALEEAEKLFQKITGNEPRLAEESQKFYADKFIFFLERSMPEVFEISKKDFTPFLDEYAFALDLLAPQWLWSALKAVFLIRHAAQASSSSPKETLSRVVQAYLQASRAPVTEAMKADVDFLEWTQDIQQAMKLRKSVLADLSSEKSTERIDPSNPGVLAYRKHLREIMSKRRSVHLPLYASYALFQWSFENPNQPQMVFDSAILGNAMHLTIVNALHFDRGVMARKTLELFHKMMPEARHALHPTVTSQQGSKFTPWISPYPPVTYFSPIDVPGQDAIEAPSSPTFAFPGGLRLSQKHAVDETPHTPRIHYGNLILQRETWHWNEGEWPTKEADPFEQFLAWCHWRRRGALPKQVYAEGMDPKIQMMFLDFENFFSAETFFASLARCKHLRMSEALPNLNDGAQGSSTVQTWTGFFYDATHLSPKVP